MGLKQIGQAARVVQRTVHSAEQRQIAQLGTAVNVALRKDSAAHHHSFQLALGLRSQNLPGLHELVANYKMIFFEGNELISPNQKCPLSDLIS
jgi:hypothetical protein